MAIVFIESLSSARGVIDTQAKTSGSEVVCGLMISPDFYTHMSCLGELLL